jgi:hypothetical protein
MPAMEEQAGEGRPREDGELERNLGEQPIAAIMAEHGYKSADLVKASSLQLTHKMVGRACRGRRLTANTKGKVLQAMGALLGRDLAMKDLFSY